MSSGCSGNRGSGIPGKKAETPVRTVRYKPDLRPYRPAAVPKTDEIVEALED